METQNFETILRQHPFFQGMKQEHIATLAGCAANAHFKKGQVIFRQNQEADCFYLVREGRVSVQIETAGQGTAAIQTLDKGDVLGWSWMFPPFVWNFDAVAMEETRAISLDARCLRIKCDTDVSLGYDLLKRFSSIVVQRLQASRIQLMDLFGPGNRPAEST